jgi:23S rRNA (pseudouridine1915-N3)-methyltransferase
MFRLRFLWVGKTQRGFVQEGVEHYLKRIGAFATAECVELRAADHSGRDPEQALRAEAAAIERRLTPGEAVIVLDEHGSALTSPQFSARLAALRDESGHSLAFVIGGAHGLDASIQRQARLKLALSAMTLPHQLVRLVLLEQVYRALTLHAGTPYHHGDRT